MDLEIRTRDIELDERLRGRITRKASSLDMRIKGITAATIELSLNNSRRKEDRYIVEVTLDVGGSALRTEERSESLVEAVTSALDALKRRVERLKHNLYRSGRSRRTTQHQVQKPQIPDGTIVETTADADES